MKYALIALMIMLMMTSLVSATPVSPRVAVQAHGPGALEGVSVSLEKYVGGVWTAFPPASQLTGNNGLTPDWYAPSGTPVRISAATLEGYTCTIGDSDNMGNGNSQLKLTTDCTKDTQVPEFGVVAAGIALLGAVGIIFVSRRQ